MQPAFEAVDLSSNAGLMLDECGGLSCNAVLQNDFSSFGCCRTG